MDSLSQLALGAAVGVGVMGGRSAVWKAALWGAVCGTLPDLDAFVDHGDPVSDMTLHRAESHALFYLTLAAPLLAGLIARLHGERDRFGRWWLAVWLALVTHPLLDAMTVYGTQLALPFTDHPFGVGSIFIIDPLYTLPVLAGVTAALAGRNSAGRRWNLAGLTLSSTYLAWSLVAQQQVEEVARTALREQGVTVERLLVTPTPFNTLLWRVVAITPEGYRAGFRSLFDNGPQLRLDNFPRGEALFERSLRGNRHAERLAWFSRGFFKTAEVEGRLVVSDLRMGQEPWYTFAFAVAEQRGGSAEPILPQLLQQRPEVTRTLAWMRQRLFDPGATPPR